MKKILVYVLALSAILNLSSFCSAADSRAVCKVRCKSKKVALTFDDGPHPVYTPEILDILSEYGVKATFFIVGENAEEHPDLIIDEIAGGHEIGCHTYSHSFINKLNSDQMKSELTKSESVMSSICDYKINYVRPPGGIYGDTFCTISEKFGYKIVLWSVDTCDWKRPSSEYIVNVINAEVGPGDIILMHDYVAGGPSSTPYALKSVIPSLLENGYEFVTLTELLSQDS